MSWYWVVLLVIAALVAGVALGFFYCKKIYDEIFERKSTNQ